MGRAFTALAKPLFREGYEATSASEWKLRTWLQEMEPKYLMSKKKLEIAEAGTPLLL